MVFERELTNLINKYSHDTNSDTPDFVLAEYIHDCLIAYTNAMNARKLYKICE